MFQTKVVEKTKDTFCVQWFFFRKSCRLWDNVEKYGRKHGVCVLHAGYRRLQIHTHSGCV